MGERTESPAAFPRTGHKRPPLAWLLNARTRCATAKDATMTPRHESPIAPETTDADAVEQTAVDGVADDGRQYPGRVRGQRLEITSADLTMYSFITGRAPSSEERERALTWAEADPTHEAIAAATGQSAMVPASYPMRAWHPTAISLRVRDIWFNGIT